MADNKISAFTLLAAAGIATGDEIPIVDVSATETKYTTMADLSARTETMTNKTLTAPVIATIVSGAGTSTLPTTTDTLVGKATTDTLTNKTLTLPVIGGVAAATGALGRDTTQLALSSFDNGMLGINARVIAAGTGSQTFTNAGAQPTDQSFTSLITLPANTVFTNKRYRVTLNLEWIAGATSVTYTLYLLLGTTKIFTSGAGDASNSVTRSQSVIIDICGRDVPGASKTVTCTVVNPPTFNLLNANTLNQPVTLTDSTAGTLVIQPGVTFSANTATESLELQAWMVEELN